MKKTIEIPIIQCDNCGSKYNLSIKTSGITITSLLLSCIKCDEEINLLEKSSKLYSEQKKDFFFFWSDPRIFFSRATKVVNRPKIKRIHDFFQNRYFSVFLRKRTILGFQGGRFRQILVEFDHFGNPCF